MYFDHRPDVRRSIPAGLTLLFLWGVVSLFVFGCDENSSSGDSKKSSKHEENDSSDDRSKKDSRDDESGEDGSEGAEDEGDESESGGEEPPQEPRYSREKFREVCSPEIEFINEEPEGRGKIFTDTVGDPIEFMHNVTATVCSILYRDPDEVPKHTKVTLKLVDIGGVAGTGNDGERAEISFSLGHIGGYENRDETSRLREFAGVLVHEATHIYQHSGGSFAFTEGVADFVRLEANLVWPIRPQRGGNWNDGYLTTGYFYRWLDSEYPDLIWNLNLYCENNIFRDSIFEQAVGIPVEELWESYQDSI